MSFKTILVHVDNTKRCDTRIDLALRLADEFAAHLTGLYVSQMPQIYAFPGNGGVESYMSLLLEEEEVNKNTAAKRFLDRTRRAGLNGAEWRNVEGLVEAMTALHARYADLVIVGQTDPNDNYPPRALDFPAALTLSVARPVLVVPYAGQPSGAGENVLVAWNGSAEATRAVSDALPLLMRAKKVTVMAVDPGGGAPQHGEVPGADLALYLARHGVTVEVYPQDWSEADVGECLLSRAADLGTDLIVMGAYGHQRLREWVLGGVTRTLVREMTVPVLMSH